MLTRKEIKQDASWKVNYPIIQHAAAELLDSLEPGEILSITDLRKRLTNDSKLNDTVYRALRAGAKHELADYAIFRSAPDRFREGKTVQSLFFQTRDPKTRLRHALKLLSTAVDELDSAGLHDLAGVIIEVTEQYSLEDPSEEEDNGNS